MLFILCGVGLPLVAFAVVFLLWYYPNANTTLLVKINVGLAWFAAMSVLVLVPADLLATLQDMEGGELLKLWWSIAYWYAFVVMMSVLPLLQGYADSGDFHPWDRFLYSVRSNAKFYLILGGLGAVGVLILYFSQNIKIEAMIGWGMAASNAYGLVGSIFLMGYGLVDIPRKLWQKADVKRRELIMFHRAGVQVERARNAHRELSKAIGLAKVVSGLFRRTDELTPFLDRINGMVDRVGDFTPEEMDLDNEDVDYFTVQDLGKLRRQLRQGIEGYQREREIYLQMARSYLGVHDIIKNMDRVGLPFISPYNTQRATWICKLEWWWKCRLQPVCMRALAILLALISVAVLVAQIAISPILPNLSVFSYIIHDVHHDAAIFSLSFMFLAYPAVAVYYTLFKLGRFSFYLLVPRHTAPYSLVSNSLFMCRFAFPLAFNYMAALALPIDKKPDPDIQKTMFYLDLGKPMAEPPFLGKRFTTYVPIVLLPYMVLVVFNVFNRVAGFFDRSQKLSFDEDWDVTSTYAATGQTMLRIEVENRDADLPLGLTVTQGGGMRMSSSHSCLAGLVVPPDLSRRSAIDPSQLRRMVKPNLGRRSLDSKYQSALEKGIGFSEPRSMPTDRDRASEASQLNNIIMDISQARHSSRANRGGYTQLDDKPPESGGRSWFGKGGHR
ncbi:hypothetical protein BSKO_10849 [Bryopsis sp. KO-2023]|nr:hypothetical protein BSKO_10849 [Bryopsis sp. KO-2023]